MIRLHLQDKREVIVFVEHIRGISAYGSESKQTLISFDEADQWIVDENLDTVLKKIEEYKLRSSGMMIMA